jgi:integrase
MGESKQEGKNFAVLYSMHGSAGKDISGQETKRDFQFSNREAQAAARAFGENAKIAANREITCLKTLYNRCIDWKRYEGENPARKVKKFEESEGKLRFLTEEEEGRLLAAAKEPLRTSILVGIYTGLRILAEALTLKWENIDLQRAYLTVEAAYAKGKQTDTLPLNHILVQARHHLQENDQPGKKNNRQGRQELSGQNR